MENQSKTPPLTRLSWCGQTDRGRIRKNNEDRFLCLQFDAEEVRLLGKVGEGDTAASDFVFAVSDGMGGACAGEFASRVAVEKITRLLPRTFRQTAEGLEAGFSDVLTELFDQIHRALMHLGWSYEECRGMGATLSMGWFTPGWMYFAHIGDSRIYYLPAREGGIQQLTHDDSHVGWLFRQGKISEREARDHPRRTVLQRALGAGHHFIDPQIGAVNCEPGDRFLFCTDGLNEGLFNAGILEILQTYPSSVSLNAAQRLVADSVAISGRDNTTALLVEVQ